MEISPFPPLVPVEIEWGTWFVMANWEGGNLYSLSSTRVVSAEAELVAWTCTSFCWQWDGVRLCSATWTKVVAVRVEQTAWISALCPVVGGYSLLPHCWLPAEAKYFVWGSRLFLLLGWDQQRPRRTPKCLSPAWRHQGDFSLLLAEVIPVAVMVDVESVLSPFTWWQ